MMIYPAIDLKEGQAVRLVQGDFAQKTVVNPDPVAQAELFAQQLPWLHIVDLDGALAGKAINADLIKAIKLKTNSQIQVGGGIRTLTQIEEYLAAGIDRLIIGSAAVKDPVFLKTALARYGEKIAVGIDAKAGKVAVSGWLEVSDQDYLAFAAEVVKLGVATIIYTDISRDGTLTGPNLAHYRALRQALPDTRLIASGGVSGKADLMALAQAGLDGAIVGKAYYEGAVTLAELSEVAQNVS